MAMRRTRPRARIAAKACSTSSSPRPSIAPSASKGRGSSGRPCWLALQQAALQLGGHGAEQFDLYRLVALAKGADGRTEPFQHLVGQGLGQADVQLAEQLVGHALGFALEGFDGGEQLARGDQHLLALGRQAEARLAALAQAEAQARLQLGHLRADGRLADAQLALSGTEAAALHHGDEQTQQLQIEVAQLAEHAGSIH